MKKIYLIGFFLVVGSLLFAQQEAGFENLNLKTGAFLNGSDGSGGFNSGGFRFVNNFNFDWFSWDGFAVSAVTDNQTKGWENQYSAITGKGALNTGAYTVSWVSGLSTVVFPETNLIGVYVTNSTYAYWSMKEGDFFSKKFGGESGNDPDWLKLTITGIKKTGETAGTIDFYLADFRFRNNQLDYIVNDWRWIDLSSLGPVVKLNFSLTSTDNGAWGMNTPAYFCLDQLNHKDMAPVVVKPVSDIIKERTYSNEIKIPLLPVFSDLDSPEERMIYSLENITDTTIATVSLTTVFISYSPLTIDAWLSVRLKGKIGQTTVTIAVNSGDKKATTSFKITAAALTSYVATDKPEIKVFPNPFNDAITIDYAGKTGSIELMDASGKSVIKKSGTASGRLYIEGLTDYPAGVYFLKISGSDIQERIKLLKIK